MPDLDQMLATDRNRVAPFGSRQPVQYREHAAGGRVLNGHDKPVDRFGVERLECRDKARETNWLFAWEYLTDGAETVGVGLALIANTHRERIPSVGNRP